MSITESQKKAIYKYRERYSELRYRVDDNEKAKITEYAKLHGLSISELSKRAVYKYMEDNK